MLQAHDAAVIPQLAVGSGLMITTDRDDAIRPACEGERGLELTHCLIIARVAILALINVASTVVFGASWVSHHLDSVDAAGSTVSDLWGGNLH